MRPVEQHSFDVRSIHWKRKVKKKNKTWARSYHSRWWGWVPARGCQAEVGYSWTLWPCWFFGRTCVSSAAGFWSEKQCVFSCGPMCERSCHSGGRGKDGHLGGKLERNGGEKNTKVNPTRTDWIHTTLLRGHEDLCDMCLKLQLTLILNRNLGETDPLLTCMETHVHFHAARSGEAFQTAVALERLDTRVRFHVCCEGALDSKSSEALFALERLLVRVDADVADEIAGLLELLGAIGTAVPANTVLFPNQAWKNKEDKGRSHRADANENSYNWSFVGTQTFPTWHLYRFLENASFLLPHWFLGSLYLLAFQCGIFTRLVLSLSGCSITMWLDHTQSAVFQSLLPNKRDTQLLFLFHFTDLWYWTESPPLTCRMSWFKAASMAMAGPGAWGWADSPLTCSDSPRSCWITSVTPSPPSEPPGAWPAVSASYDSRRKVMSSRVMKNRVHTPERR